jgi:prepilin-type N-terminal cleavage/methylation domain-containing protein
MKKSARKSGFTLVEILIVVVIMGILAAIVVPQFAQSSDDARYSSTIQNLQSLRGQIDLFRNHHENLLPGDTADSANDTVFTEHMTLPTNEAGARSTNADQGFGDVAFPYGPYINNQLPANPFNGSRAVQNVAGFAGTAPGGNAVGWVYDRRSGRIKINKTGTIPDGTATYWSL